AISAHLSFWAKWEIEAGYDYTQLQVSTDGGTSWIPQCGNYTSTGSADQDQGNPLWDGTQNTWVKEEIDLSDYFGQVIQFRFQLVSDNWVTGDGFYFDDFEVTTVFASVEINEQNTNPFQISQNMPNPSSGYTYINYHIPSTTADASLNITNAVGQLIEKIKLNPSSRSTLLNTKRLSPGNYLYFIQADQIRSASKRMVILN
ncbi:MAG: T9SS type A sorting domain-containing protein, partial [Crocinitomicaceae bacterium]|nr:T9SS type A sorting domain-containing protein [Crocinitomicaceae bacterium]